MRHFLFLWFYFAVIGVFAETVFTALAAAVRGSRSGKGVDFHLYGQSMLWSIPVYGLSAAVGFHPLVQAWLGIPRLAWFLRGALYAAVIFALEFSWGWAIEIVIGFCPWDYRPARWNVKGWIRLDYAPFWFCFGLILERAASVFDRVWPYL